MIALTAQDINVAWFILGALSAVVGAGIIAFVRWQREPVQPPTKSDAIARVNHAALITPSQSGLDALMTELLAESRIPQQRTGVER